MRCCILLNKEPSGFGLNFRRWNLTDTWFEIVGYKFENTYVRLYKNHVYESRDLKKDKNYRVMMGVVDKLSKVYKYTSKIKSSNDMVSYLMILMNYYTALEMIKYNNGLFHYYKVKDEWYDRKIGYARCGSTLAWRAGEKA